MNDTPVAVAPSADRVRLHISPFSPALFNSVIPKATQSLVESLSYHHPQNNPAGTFGYLELPAAEADRLRKKLNGATLRGTKMSIEKARPEKRKASEVDKTDKKASRPKKRVDRKDDSAEKITGVELPEGRKVKRGWTEASKGSSKGQGAEKSKYSNKEEILFRTGRNKEDKKKSKSGDKIKKSTKKEIVHEFEHNTKVPTFLRQSEQKRQGGQLTFVDGQGWINEDGEVVEQVKSNRRARMAPPQNVPRSEVALGITGLETQPGTELVEDEDASESDKSSSTSESDSMSSSSSSSGSSVEDEVVGTVEPVRKARLSTPQQATSPPRSKISKAIISTEMGPPAIMTTPPSDAGPVNSVHPLEALYKRRPEDMPKVGRLDTSFSFGFDGAAEEGEKGVPVSSALLPQTPFTQQDLRFRGIRSAAPTPDTAVASRKFFPDLAPGGHDPEDEDNDGEDGDSTGGGGEYDSATETQDEQTKSNTASNTTVGVSEERSAFVKEFYERRSELNRGFKERRREAKRQLRHREDKSHGGVRRGGL